ncbi:MAG TPA: putative Ig domain-containing protein [Gammaproteobacteria bacterium]
MALVSCGGEDSDGGQQAQTPSGTPSGNQPPTIEGNPPSQILSGSALDFTPTSNDADGDALTFSIENPPSWATFDAQTGHLSGTPGDGDVGAYADIRISVSDGEATASLGPFSIEVVTTAVGTATLSWLPPTEKTDGSPLELAGYKIYWGTASRSYSHVEEVGAGTATYVIENLTPATWYFAVTAVDSEGLESDYSNEASKEVM